jgi:glutamate/aspartate transport system substrate-binding protein
VHIECGVTTNNLSRQASVAFANTTYLETIRMLVKANSGIRWVADLGGKVVATTNGSTSVQLLRKNKRATDIQFNETFCKDHADCFLLVQSGRADAFVLDNSILATLRARARNPGDFKIVGEPLSTEPIAIMLPKGDAPFKKLADDTIAQLARSGELNKLYDKWFLQPTPPANVVLDLPMSAEMKALIAQPNDKPVEEYAQDR